MKFKKKDLKKVNLEELVDPDGSPIGDTGRDSNYNKNNQPNNTSVIKAPNTSDAQAKIAIQPNRLYGITSVLGGTSTLAGMYDTLTSDKINNGEEQESDKEDIHTIDKLKTKNNINRNVHTEGKQRFKKLVEDILTTNNNHSEFVPNKSSSNIISPDTNRNGIPDIDELNKTKPEAVRNVQDFITNIKTTPLTPDESAIILNYVVANMKSEHMSTDYKMKLKGSI